MKRKALSSLAALAAVVFVLAFSARRAVAQEQNGATQSQSHTVEPKSRPLPASDVALAGDSPVLNDLLHQARFESAQLDVDADSLLFVQRSEEFRESHGVELNIIRQHINEIGKLEARMREARDSGSPWQQNAVDQIGPLLQELADNMENAIAHYNQNGLIHPIGKYADYLKANADLAAKLHTLISDAVSYGQAKGKYDALDRAEGSK